MPTDEEKIEALADRIQNSEETVATYIRQQELISRGARRNISGAKKLAANLDAIPMRESIEALRGTSSVVEITVGNIDGMVEDVFKPSPVESEPEPAPE